MVILDDSLPEKTECFTFNIESLDPDIIEVDEKRVQKRLCILDDDGMCFYCNVSVSFSLLAIVQLLQVFI